MKEHGIQRQSLDTAAQTSRRHNPSWWRRGGWPLLALLLLALAACSPGGATNTGSNPQATGTAPIHVPQGYHGMIVISFAAGTTYVQAKAAVESAGLKLAVPCPNAGPIPVDATPRPPTDQSATFSDAHQLTAVGNPSLTTTMLNQVASEPGVTSVDVQPPVECPLIAVGA